MTSAIFCLTWPGTVPENSGLKRVGADPLRRLRRLESSAAVILLAAPDRTDLYVHGDASGLMQFRTALHRDHRHARGPREFQDEAAIARLLRFAAGLDSPLLGAQTAVSAVRAALRQATSGISTDLNLAALFEWALDTSERVNHKSLLDRARRAGLRMACDLIRRRVAEGKGVLVLGDDIPTAEWSARLAGGSRATILAPSGRALERGAAASRGPRRAAPPPSMRELLSGVEAVVLCASEPRTLITASMLAGRDRPLLILNVGREDSVDAEVAFLPDVQLVHALDLCGGSPLWSEALAEAEAVVRADAERAAEMFVSRSAGSTMHRFNPGANGASHDDARRSRPDALPPPLPIAGEAAA